MGIVSKLLGGREERAVSVVPSSVWRSGLADTAAGVTVSEGRALQYSAVVGCVRILAESVAALPLILYERSGARGKARARSHRLYGVLHDLANSELTAFELRELLMVHLTLWGNAYAEIEYDQAGRVIGLWPLRPDRMEIRRERGELVYWYRMPNEELRAFAAERIFHLRGMGMDGTQGVSPIRYFARDSVGLGIAAEKFGAKFFGNGARAGGVLMHPGILDDDAYEQLKTSWAARHEGLDNAHRVAILEEGMTYQDIGVPPEDAQFLETRKFQVTEIARIYRVPPHMLADLDRATFSNIEHQDLAFVKHTLRPWLTRWEQAIARDLLSETERSRYFAQFLTEDLLRGDVTSRYQAYQIARANGWMSANEIRERENMDPIPDGDTFLMPLNMTEVGSDDDQAGDAPADDMPAGERSLAVARETREVRAQRSGDARYRLALAQREVYADAAGRILRREANDILNAAKRILARGSAEEFRLWLQDFWQQHRQFSADQMRPVAQAFAALLMDELVRETESPVEQGRVRAFMDAYLEQFAVRHTNRQNARVEAALAEAEPLAALETETDGWREERAAVAIAREETTRTNGAVALMAYAAAGITLKRWLNQGSETCPYCRSLHGKIVELNKPFITAGDNYQPEGADVPLSPRYDVGHAPAHDGCDCVIVSA